MNVRNGVELLLGEHAHYGHHHKQTQNAKDGSHDWLWQWHNSKMFMVFRSQYALDFDGWGWYAHFEC